MLPGLVPTSRRHYGRVPVHGWTVNWVHHSDRGVQYASDDYTGLLKDRGANISMSRKGNPYDNATPAPVTAGRAPSATQRS